MDIAEAHFAASEVQQLHDTPQANQAAAFTRLWVLKEACLKALGRGLSEPLHSVSFHPSSAVPATLPRGAGNPTDWQCAVQEPVPGIYLAAAVRGGPGRFLKWDCASTDICGTTVSQSN
jgi:4'-phosphopantetheinyl transferase